MHKTQIPWLAGSLMLVAIYYPVFFSDFAYLDEAHQLWYSDTTSNFNMFLVQGRLLTGFIIDKLFSSIDTISALKWIRVLSFAGWLVAVLYWNRTLLNWKEALQLDQRLVFFLSIFLPCSISVAITIGWASCIEISLAFLLGLLSGQLLFKQVHGKKEIRIPTLTIILIILFGTASLFLYQPMFAAFLLPFFIYHISNRYNKIDKVLVIGIVFFLVTTVIYFLLYKYSLKQYGVVAGDRTEWTTDPLKKIAFFFSQPLAQAFSFNFLYNFHGIFSQVFYPVMLAGWLVSVFVMEKAASLGRKLTYVIIVLLMMALMYVSILMTKENFASYRTMVCLNLAGTMLLMDGLLRVIKRNNIKNIFVYGLCAIVLAVGWFNFNINYNNPLRKEYQAVSTYFREKYKEGVTKVYFIRPPEALFTELYGVKVYKDEFGLPSTYKDWTPEPLVRQMVFEITKNREKAKELEFFNLPYEEGNTVRGRTMESNTMLMDVKEIMKRQ